MKNDEKTKIVLYTSCILGLLLLTIGFFGIFQAVDINFNCNRSNSTCHIKTINITGDEKLIRTINLNQLTSAFIKKYRSYGKYNSGTNCKVLLFSNGLEINLIPLSKDCNKQYSVANQINQFLTNSKQEKLSIIYPKDDRVNLGIILTIIGAFLLLPVAGFLTRQALINRLKTPGI